MAESLNISQSTYAQLESGKISISDERLKKISKILEMDMNKLLSPEDLKLDIHNNTFHDNSSVIAQLNNKNEELYERLLQEKEDKNKLLQETISFLKDEIQKLKNT